MRILAGRSTPPSFIEPTSARTPTPPAADVAAGPVHVHSDARPCRPAPPRPLAHEVHVGGLHVALEDVARLAPVVLLHPKEKFLPCSVETLLARGALLDGKGAVVKHDPTQEDLVAHNDDNARVAFDPVHYAGEPCAPDNTVRAPMYVSAQAGPNNAFIDLQYIFLFAYNGPQTARVRVPGLSYNCILPRFAEHEGDIEGVHMRVTPDCKNILRIGTAGHGRPTYTHPKDVRFENTHPVVRCAYNSHATYNDKGRAREEWIVTDRYAALHWGAEFIDLTANNGPRWQPFAVDANGQTHATDQLVFVGLTRDGIPMGNQPWAAFRGKLGAHWSNHYQGARAIGGGPLSRAQAGYANSIAHAAIAAGATKERSDSNGTHGLGVRTFICEDAAKEGDAKF